MYYNMFYLVHPDINIYFCSEASEVQNIQKKQVYGNNSDSALSVSLWRVDARLFRRQTLSVRLGKAKSARRKIGRRMWNTLHAVYEEGTSEVISTAIIQLDEYFARKRTAFDMPLLLAGTDFQKTVWQELLNIPYGKTVASVCDSIVKASEKGKIKIRKVEDLTSGSVEILVHLAPGVSSDKTIDALYAFTDCEVSISPNCCVIDDQKPHFLTVSDVLRKSVDNTLALLRQELEIRKGEILESLHFASLEKIFIEERIYKDKEFEQAKNMDAACEHIDERLTPYYPTFIREVTKEDILRLMEIKMARILKFNSDKAEELIARMRKDIEEIDCHLANIVEYTVDWSVC